ncbi:hypothetical protein BST45_00080 [Mycobacterium shinjukuense]|nr:hypothetical protein BST45_00080 [Mycobacterium shinjukuense]
MTRRTCNHGGLARRVAATSARSAQPVHTRRGVGPWQTCGRLLRSIYNGGFIISLSRRKVLAWAGTN